MLYHQIYAHLNILQWMHFLGHPDDLGCIAHSAIAQPNILRFGALRFFLHVSYLLFDDELILRNLGRHWYVFMVWLQKYRAGRNLESLKTGIFFCCKQACYVNPRHIISLVLPSRTLYDSKTADMSGPQAISVQQHFSKSSGFIGLEKVQDLAAREVLPSLNFAMSGPM